MPDAPPAPPPTAPHAACPSCGAERTGAYCTDCGQRHFDRRLTLRQLWSDFVSRAFSLDRGLFYTLSRLAGGPGRVPADYVAGRQRPYTHPLSFYLLVAALSLLSASLYQERIIESAGEAGASIIQIADENPDDADSPLALLRAAAERVDGDDGQGLIRRSTQIQNRLATPLLVFFALFLVGPLRLVFGRQRNVAETAIFSLYVVGFATLGVALVSPLLFLALPIVAASLVQAILTLLAYAGLTAWGAVGFWNPGRKTIAKAAFAGLLGYLVYTVVVGMVSIVLLVGELLDAAGLTWREVLSA
ncbi:DUF3667 domain-containing protein [Rubrivirga sp. IMCC43871]|uniref:DUF3667 domain-containing protein n=1 Tax=Rubrivirga sp. IMCC43871 TaxID=3391575 RepID=UPI00398FD2F6